MILPRSVINLLSVAESVYDGVFFSLQKKHSFGTVIFLRSIFFFRFAIILSKCRETRNLNIEIQNLFCFELRNSYFYFLKKGYRPDLSPLRPGQAVLLLLKSLLFLSSLPVSRRLLFQAFQKLLLFLLRYQAESCRQLQSR